MLQAELKVIGGRQNGKLIPLGQKFLIGREQDCHLRPSSELVSRHHCVFTLDDYTLRLRDLGSTNGTFVNGERLEGQIVLQAGDRVAVGKLEFEVQVHEAVTPEMADDEQFHAEDDSRIISTTEGDEAGNETLVDVKLPLPDAQAEAATEEFQSDDTGTIPAYNPQQAYPPGMMPPPGYYPPMPPGYYPMQPGMPYPMQPGMPMGYPQYYPQPAQPVEQEAAPENTESASDMPDVRLPDPSETGVKEEAVGSGGGQAKSKGGDGSDPSSQAANLLNKMRQRR